MALGDAVSELGLKEWFAKLLADSKELRAPTLSMNRLSTGHVGYIPYAFNPSSPTPFVTTKVLQVIDESNCLISIQSYVLTQRLVRNQFKDVLGTINPTKGNEYFVWAKMNTTDLADDDGIKLRGAWKVTGTKSYETVTGKRTVYVIEPMIIAVPKPNDPEIALLSREIERKREQEKRTKEDAHKQAAAEAKARRETELEEQLTRTWHDISGKFRVTARLAGLSPLTAKLTKVDGSTVEVQLSQLKRDDREWIAKSGKRLLDELLRLEDD